MLILGTLLTAVSLHAWNAAVEANDAARFARDAEALHSLVNRRLSRVLNGLNDIAALYAVTGRLETVDLQRYLAKRELGGSEMGMRGFGVVEHLRREDVHAFEARQRLRGDPAFAVRANGAQAPDLFVIRTLEPA
ncbi:MAG TPA: CHASE domain-containing protein, partial [Ramlibacter sp.]